MSGRSIVWALVFITISWAGTGGVKADAGQEPGGQVVRVGVPAPALDGNLLGSPLVQNAAVYLPPSYGVETSRRFPVIYLLHGIFDKAETWTRGFRVPEMLDRLIADGKLPELIAVMPDGGNKYGGGFYRNSPVSGNWADYIAKDLVRFVDTQFRTLPDRSNRAVVGHSMGGYGALNLAMTQADVFSVVWAMSPCCLAAREDIGFGNDAWKRAAAVASPEDIKALVESRDFFPIAILALLTAFSPDEEAAPVYGAFPFEIVRGEIVLKDEVYDRYIDRFPVRQVSNARAALRSLRGLAIDTGLGDQFQHIPPGVLEFSQHLGTERIPHLLDVYSGDHRQEIAERLEHIVLPWVAGRLAAGETKQSE